MGAMIAYWYVATFSTEATL